MGSELSESIGLSRTKDLSVRGRTLQALKALIWVRSAPGGVSEHPLRSSMAQQSLQPTRRDRDNRQALTRVKGKNPRAKASALLAKEERTGNYEEKYIACATY